MYIATTNEKNLKKKSKEEYMERFGGRKDIIVL